MAQLMRNAADEHGFKMTQCHVAPLLIMNHRIWLGNVLHVENGRVGREAITAAPLITSEIQRVMTERFLLFVPIRHVAENQKSLMLQRNVGGFESWPAFVQHDFFSGRRTGSRSIAVS